MEERILKVAAQLALLFIVIWIVASALGRRSDMQVNTPPVQRGRDQRQWAKGDVWAHNPVIAPGAQGTFAPVLTMR